MLINAAQTREYLRALNFKALFIEQLGWDNYKSEHTMSVDGQKYTLTGVAHKRGVSAYVCYPVANGKVPDKDDMRKIETELAKLSFHHIIIYPNVPQRLQVWQTVIRRAGKPISRPQHTYYWDQPGTSLIAKLQDIAVAIEDDETLDHVGMVQQLSAAFNAEKVTKRFYERFQKEHDAFLKFVSGIPDEGLQRWYASVMLNRLMFIYFIQEKGFLDGKADYLRRKLEESKQRGTDQYYSVFLRTLFFDGFATRSGERSYDTRRMLGDIPYLNGGIFAPHQIEQLHGNQIRIPDAAFEDLFTFFEAYDWHLDERPLRNDNEINPDVLGYIFEKYINQKQMGAYYTKEDITDYISKNTIIPFLFVAAEKQDAVAFRPEGPVWRLLQEDLDRYIYPAVRKGADLALPPDIEVGVGDASRRGGWNRPAPEEYALPTEIWREVIARRQRYTEIRQKIASGKVTTINDLITLNLDIRQFAQDVIENAEGSDLVLAFYRSIEKITVLDPTCGSGAFLFAALNILEPLYEACLDKMQAFLDELDASPAKHSPLKYSNFREILDEAGKHTNRRYFVYKSIILNNLYGVDIMEEAVEICKLRLFLKLVAQVDRDSSKENGGIAPLPDIDFNIRAANTLVGFATYEEVQRASAAKSVGNVKLGKITGEEQQSGQAQQIKFGDEDIMQRIEEKASDLDRLFSIFRERQTTQGGTITADDKAELRRRSRELEDELNGYLAREYGKDPSKAAELTQWQNSHEPFHWFVEFYGIMKRGGFDVIIGNPPYVAYSKVKDQYRILGYRTESTANLYAFVLERAFNLLRETGSCGMIVPIASVSTEGMRELQRLYDSQLQWHSHFAVRPGKLFAGVDMNLTITILQKCTSSLGPFVTSYRRWSSGEDSDRLFLFSTISYIASPPIAENATPYPKLGTSLEIGILRQMLSHRRKLAHYQDPQGTAIYYHSGGRYWRKALPVQLSSHYKAVNVPSQFSPVVFALLNSQLFYWYWIGHSNCMDVVSREVLGLPVFRLEEADEEKFRELMDTLLQSYYGSNTTRQRQGERINVEEINFDVRKSKHILDLLDRRLAVLYGFNTEQLDFILNYDIKYRMGRDSDA